MIARERLQELEQIGWHLTRDGSTATARRNWEDPEDTEVAWQVMVLHTAGHPNRFSLDTDSISERNLIDLLPLREALAGADELLADWTGELPVEETD